MTPAPYFAAVADGPADGSGFWLTTPDGCKIRVVQWNAKAPKGTVLLLPGRTEYCEKYGRTAADLAAHGYATLTIDWRGQGMSNRALPDPLVGHVVDFAEYQVDLAAMVAHARMAGLPQPFYMMAHSMGGCIGLRGVMNGCEVKAVAFSGPMWGLIISAWMRPIASLLGVVSRALSFDDRYAPGTNAAIYVTDLPFVGNVLTTDVEMWDYMRQQALAHPELSLAGPSFAWARAALTECHALGQLPSPAIAAICGLGSQERVVYPASVVQRMASWPGGRLDMYPGAEHEILMERPATRSRFITTATDLFDQNP